MSSSTETNLVPVPSVMDDELNKLIQDMLYVGGVPDNQKLSLTDRGYHEKTYYYAFVRRCRKESKEKTVEFIDKLVIRCSQAILRYKKSDYYPNLIESIVSLHGGVRKLSNTYKEYPDTKGQLQVALMQLNNYIPESYKKNIPH